MKLEVLFAPAELIALGWRDLSRSVCVVFDVLRATSTMVTALAHGASAIIPVAEIPEAMEWHRTDPTLLLAGEREGLRIRKELTGSIDFDLGNSPREFVPEKVRGKRIVMTTTNGTRALRSCAGAHSVWLGSFLNLDATADHLSVNPPPDLLVVCSGTADQVACEDVLGAGALCDRLWQEYSTGTVADSARMARRLFQLEQDALGQAVGRTRNGARLLAQPILAEDVAFCLQRNLFPLVAELKQDGVVRRLTA